MVVLFVTPYLSGRRENLVGGGLEVYLLRVTKALKKMGHTPIILSLGKKETHYIQDDIERFFVQCPETNLIKGNLKFRLILERICQSMVINKKIAELSRERRIDLIQFPSPYSLALCYYGKTPAVMRMSSYSKIYNNYEDYEKVSIETWALCERLAAKRCNAVFAPSNVIAKAFSEDIYRPVTVIESPFYNDCESYNQEIYQAELSDKKYFLFFGRMVADKGILVIAECLYSFLEMHQDYYFVCCGEDNIINGESAEHILRKAAGIYERRFVYMKPLTHEALYPIIQHADFVVFPSLIENLSNAFIEAMYFKRVVIGTDGASYEQLIDDGVNGLLCKPKDPVGLLAKMNEAAAMNEVQKTELGEKARKRIDKLRPEKVVKKLLKYYQWVIENTSR